MKKLPYWVRGGIVGGLLSIPLIIFLITRGSFYLTMIFTPPSIILAPLFSWFLGELSILLCIVMNWFLLGALGGLIIGEIKKKEATNWLKERLKIEGPRVITIAVMIICLLLMVSFYVYYLIYGDY